MNIDLTLRTIAPETVNLTQDQRQNLINIAKVTLKFGNNDIRDLATAYMAAHINALSTRGGAAGSVTSEKEGDLSRSFGGSGIMGSLGSTAYGLEVKRLQDMSILGPRTRQVMR